MESDYKKFIVPKDHDDDELKSKAVNNSETKSVSILKLF